MSEDFNNDSMMELYLFESTTLLDNLDSILLSAESDHNLTQENINEVFRIMHTIKGSSAMMEYNAIAGVSHKAEDLFSIIRDNGIIDEYFDQILDLVLRVSEFLEKEVSNLEEGEPLLDEPPELIKELSDLSALFKENAPEKKPIIDIGKSLGGEEKKAEDVQSNFPEVSISQPEPIKDTLSQPEPIKDILNQPEPEEISPTQAVTSIPQEEITFQHAPEGGRILGIEPNNDEEALETNLDTSDGIFDNSSFEPTRRMSGSVDEAQSSLMTYNLHVHFNEGSKMENIRAFMLVNKLNETGTVERTIPDNLENNENAVNTIIENGFYVKYTTSLFRNQIESIAKGTLSVESTAFVRKLPDETEASVSRVTSPPPVQSINEPKEPIAEMSSSITPEEIKISPAEEAAPQQIQSTPSEPSPSVHADAIADESLATGNNEVASEQSNQSAQTIQDSGADKHPEETDDTAASSGGQTKKPTKQNIISVDLTKLDSLLDLVGEIVITESMVTQNSDLEGMDLDNFTKAARQLNKLTDELQDTVMSVRMVQVSTTFQRMRRVVRDMSKKLGKETELIMIGEQTEVDKTMLDALADSLMHLVRNAMDHAIETPDERKAAGKNATGHIVLSAQNMGGDVIISVSDDGRGLDSEKILASAASKGMLKKPESEYTEKEIFNLLMTPGFSTKSAVTEFSGRGVGMDVVRSNIEKIGGTVIIESVKGTGTNILLKLPLTLAIIDCMEISLGDSVFAIPITNIKESFKSSAGQLLSDPLGSEMIMLRGVAYPVVRLHSLFGVDDAIKNIEDGILILVDSGDKIGCLLTDGLLGKFQVVVKPVPKYLSTFNVKGKGISGCTIMGNGEISLILDIQEILL